MGLIHARPEGPEGNPNPLAAVKDIGSGGRSPGSPDLGSL
jgi:catalase (peroxidase I)